MRDLPRYRIRYDSDHWVIKTVVMTDKNGGRFEVKNNKGDITQI